VVTVHGSSDPQRVGVVARDSRKIRESIAFDEFATYIDYTIAAAIEFFAGLDSVAECTAQPLLLDAG
jgi:hypothetical protein